MKRRSLFAVIGAICAGCTTPLLSSEPPKVEQENIDVVERICGDEVSEDASVEQVPESDFEVSIHGKIRVPNVNYGLVIDISDGIGYRDREDDAMEVDILYSSTSSEHIEGNECEGGIEYQSNIRLSKEPKSITVNHMKEKESGDGRTKETILTKSFE